MSSNRARRTADRNHQTHVPQSDVVHCDICMEQVSPSDSLQLDCPHRYCRNCLRRTFFFGADSIPIVKPPACCGLPVSPADAARFLTPDEQKTWNRKMRESAADDPLFCKTPSCDGYWISPKHYDRDRMGRNIAVCPKCRARHCRKCKELAHGDRPCAKDVDEARLLKYASKKGCVRCPSCRTIVERSAGCNHMHCPCGAHFCYTCGTAYIGSTRRCDCPLEYRGDGSYGGRARDAVLQQMVEMDLRDTTSELVNQQQQQQQQPQQPLDYYRQHLNYYYEQQPNGYYQQQSNEYEQQEFDQYDEQELDGYYGLQPDNYYHPQSVIYEPATLGQQTRIPTQHLVHPDDAFYPSTAGPRYDTVLRVPNQQDAAQGRRFAGDMQQQYHVTTRRQLIGTSSSSAGGEFSARRESRHGRRRPRTSNRHVRDVQHSTSSQDMNGSLRDGDGTLDPRDFEEYWLDATDDTI